MMLEVIGPALQTLAAQPVIPIIASLLLPYKERYSFVLLCCTFHTAEQTEELAKISALTLVSKEQQ
jgi:hypothetical protein